MVRSIGGVVALGLAVWFIQSRLPTDTGAYGIEMKVVSGTPIDRQPGQIVRVKVANRSKRAWDIKVKCRDLGQLEAEVEGPGSMEQPLRLGSRQETEIVVVVDGTTAGESVMDSAVAMTCLVKVRDDQGERWTFAEAHAFSVFRTASE